MLKKATLYLGIIYLENLLYVMAFIYLYKLYHF